MAGRYRPECEETEMMHRNAANLFMVMALLGVGMSGCIGGPATEESGEGMGRGRGRVCGGRLGDTCRRNQYCAYSPEAMCGATDMTGVCRPRPAYCIELFDPVCGCDGETYGNACFAASAGVSVLYEGECEPPPEPEPRPCGGILGLTCDEGDYCAFTTDQDCGAGDQQGVCTPRPEACIQLYDPVCGCDGETHGNACTAASAGVSVAHAGECTDEIFCGGIAGLPCPEGMVCELDGDYPDAGGHCVPAPAGDCRDAGCPDGWSCLNCFAGYQCLPPDAMCAF